MQWPHNIVFGILITIGTMPLAAQEDQGGLIMPTDSLSKFLPERHFLYLPEDGFTFYEAPSGNFKAKILPGLPLDSKDKIYFDTLLTATLAGNQIRSTILPANYFFEITDSSYYMTFSQNREGFLYSEIDEFQGWISMEEISKKGFKVSSWVEFYGQTKNRDIHPRAKTAPIRSSPSDEASIVETADELYSEITTTGKYENSYAHVKIIQYKNPYDPTQSKEDNIEKKYKGWIKIIDEEGRPLVAHNH